MKQTSLITCCPKLIRMLTRITQTRAISQQYQLALLLAALLALLLSYAFFVAASPAIRFMPC